MIRVERSSVERPAILSPGRQAGLELAKATDFYAHRDRFRQQRFEFKLYRDRSVREALTQLFHGKCAYCEATVSVTQPIHVEFFRPKAGVLESPHHPGYWWLAMVWENMLASCSDCNRIRVHEGIRTGKANRFPLVDENKRWFDPQQWNNEEPLLLDPCNDYPEDHLVFDVSGTVASDTDKGKASIAVLGLNRPALVAARRDAARDILERFSLLDDLRGEVRQRQLEAIHQMTQPDAEFTAMKRQVIASLMEKYKGVMADGEPELAQATTRVSRARKRRAKKEYAAFEVAQSSYTLQSEEGRTIYRGQRRLIERIIIEDIKAIQKLDVDLTSGTGRTAWLMLLGENGTGKSTVLQTAALALLGAQEFVKLAQDHGVHPKDFVRFRRKQGSVAVKLSGFPKPHKLVFRKESAEFTSPTNEKTTIDFTNNKPTINGDGWVPQTLLLGYGATKLLPRGVPTARIEDDPVDVFSRVDNLFDPFVPLMHAEKWLLSLDRQRFNETAIILKDLMSLTSAAELVCESDTVVVVEHGSRVPLSQLSDGYQSVVAMTADILELTLRLWPNLLEAEGIVLLDEVGAHLHPTWKMKIVASLRKALPAMQFLATTHDPLCLRGLGKGEVAVMRRGHDSEVTALTDLPSPADFRIDQLLTSDFFGLNSTVDPDVEAVFDEYYALLAMASRDEAQEKRLSELREELKDRRYLGNTMRESLMYEAVDRLMAQRRIEPTIPIGELKQSAVDEVAKIWAEPLNPEAGVH